MIRGAFMGRVEPLILNIFYVRTMKILHIAAFLLTIVGALNWGLVGIGMLMNADYNLVHLLVGSWPTLEAVVYVLVGLSGVALLATHRSDCKTCNA